MKITRKREREIGLVVSANFVYITKDKNCSIILETQLEKRKILFQDLQESESLVKKMYIDNFHFL